MKREILFKAKRLDGGTWIAGSLQIENEVTFIYNSRDKMVAVDPETVCQYIGLEDKNNNKIFEGDILKIPMFKPQYLAVGFIEGAFCLVNAKGEYVADIHYIHHAGVNNAEVHGTIFTHKYLLED